MKLGNQLKIQISELLEQLRARKTTEKEEEKQSELQLPAMQLLTSKNSVQAFFLRILKVKYIKIHSSFLVNKIPTHLVYRKLSLLRLSGQASCYERRFCPERRNRDNFRYLRFIFRNEKKKDRLGVAGFSTIVFLRLVCNFWDVK